MIRIELTSTSTPDRRWVVTVEPDDLPWMGTKLVLTDEEMTALLQEVGRVRHEQRSGEPE